MGKATKYAIEQALIELCRTTPFGKIKINTICEKADISRQTFYNHFKDKYDIVAAIYLRDISSEEAESGYYSLALMRKGLNTLWDRRDFYRNVLNGREQNDLYNFIADYTININIKWIAERQKRALTMQEKYEIIYCAYGYIGSLFEWLKGNIDYTPDEFAEIEYKTFPPITTSVFQ